MALSIGFLFSSAAQAQTDAEKAAANPVAKKISLEYQSTFQFDYGDEEKTGYTGVFQPVIPFSVGPVNFINRPMLPVIALPEVTLSDDGTIPGLPVPPVGQPGERVSKTGIGDFTYQLFLSPAKPGKIIWGVLCDEGRRGVLTVVNQEEMAKVVRPNDWNDYVIRCVGKKIQFWVNGYQTLDYTETDEKIESTGVIGLQAYGGGGAGSPPTEAWYKDIEIKEITPLYPK